jgi:TPR repeat protein
MYAQGHGVPQDYTEALKWFHLAANQGNANAQYMLGYLYEYGRGVPQSNTFAEVAEDVTEAIKWYRLAAKQGYQDAQAALRRLGEAVP